MATLCTNIYLQVICKTFLSSYKLLSFLNFLKDEFICYTKYVQGVPKKISLQLLFKFLSMGGVFLGVKNNSLSFENKKNYRLLSKILSKWTLFVRKRQKIMGFQEIMALLKKRNSLKCHNSLHFCVCKYEYQIL